MNRDEYRHCLKIAKRHARNAADAEDLLHAALLVAIDHHRISMGDGKDRALHDLDELDGGLRELVEMKFFGGLSYREIAGIQQRSERTIKRDWVRARAFLVARAGSVPA